MSFGRKTLRIAGLAAGLGLWTAMAAAADSSLPGEDDDGWTDRLHGLVRLNAEAGRQAASPLLAPMTVCQDTACAKTDRLSLAPEEAERIRAVFTPPAADAAEERAMIGRAIAFYETFVGSRNGSWADLPRNLHPEEGGEGQMDCVSESANTKTYLDRLAQAGFLTHHRVKGLVYSYVLLLQHVAVEIVEIADGERWVVDSWEGANGEPPAIEPYGDWRMGFHI